MLRYWHTARHLRPVQVYGRAWHRLHAPKPDTRPAPGLREWTRDWRAPAAKPPSMRGPDEVVFLNAAGRIADAADWDRPERDRLWRYNLHYFDDLNAAEADARETWHRGLMSRWIAENPPGLGSGWEPYPLSLRIVNWSKWALSGHRLDEVMRQSLAVQARFLRGRLEWHLLGNHLFANAKALAFAGALFQGEEAAGWLAKGLEILAREVPEQILPDGGHFELSPMYHALILEDLLDLLNLAAAFPGVVPDAQRGVWRAAVARMRAWHAAMTHPDGEIAFFNDAATGIAPPPAALEAYAVRLGLAPSQAPSDGLTHLADSGYVRLAGPASVLLLDVAPVGPDYLPGHAHADTLSFELSLHEQRLVVNSGTSVYGTGPERLRQRSTSAHSTVEVDGENSSEVWSGFRVARRARPFGLHLSDAGGAQTVACAHSGYRRLPGRVTHHREWRLGDRSLTVTDRLEGRYDGAVARFFLHPGVAAESDGRRGRFTLEGGQTVAWSVEEGAAALVDTTWHPAFGVSRPTTCLEVDLAGPSCSLTLDW
jgi:uncharacterized heparinase superfamily protein